jgi:hypothetical protein
LSEDDIIAILDELGDLVAALGDADPEQKLDVYRNVGLYLTYDPGTRTVRASIDLAAHRWNLVGVRGSTQTKAPRQETERRAMVRVRSPVQHAERMTKPSTAFPRARARIAGTARHLASWSALRLRRPG